MNLLQLSYTGIRVMNQEGDDRQGQQLNMSGPTSTFQRPTSI